MRAKVAKRKRAEKLYGPDVSDSTKILRYLAENDHITRVQALGLFRIHNATARISELRKEGWDIRTDERTDVTGRRYARWSLAQRDRDLVRALLMEGVE